MKLKYILGLGSLTLASVANAQVGTWRSDTLATGTGYAQDAYFHLEDGQVKAEANNNWDLALEELVRSCAILFTLIILVTEKAVS